MYMYIWSMCTAQHITVAYIHVHVHVLPLLWCRYCRSNFDPNHDESRDVYLCLFKMYLSPPDLEEFGIRVPEGSQPEANVDDALKVLMSHHSRIDTAKV